MNKAATIHLAEDDESLRLVYTMMLEVEGFNVSVSANGQEAIDYLSEHDVDLVILDLFMPVLDGIHVLQWIRDEKKYTTPVLVLTSMTDDETRLAVMASGANLFLNKPVGVATIIKSVVGLLDQ